MRASGRTIKPKERESTSIKTAHAMKANGGMTSSTESEERSEKTGLFTMVSSSSARNKERARSYLPMDLSTRESFSITILTATEPMCGLTARPT